MNNAHVAMIAVGVAVVAFAAAILLREPVPASEPLTLESELQTQAGTTAPDVGATGEQAPKPKAKAKAASDLILADLAKPPFFGSREPLVTVMVCTDFQCPVCGRAAREMYKVMEALEDKVRFEIWNNALEMHRDAERAAIAGLAAHRQGKFWAMHDGMFNHRQLSESGLLEEARISGLNIERYLHDIADPRLKRQVEAEGKLCRALGARGTPAYFVNGERHVGWGSAFGFQKIVEKHVGYAEQALAQGTERKKIYETLAREHATEPVKFVSMVLHHIIPAASSGR